MGVTLIIGNVASGKTTLAKSLGAPVFHADSHAWKGFSQRQPTSHILHACGDWLDSLPDEDIDHFIVEGVYGKLADEVALRASRVGVEVSLIWLDTPTDECLRRFDARGLEPDKFPCPVESARIHAYVRKTMAKYDTLQGDMGRDFHRRLTLKWGGVVWRQPIGHPVPEYIYTATG